MEANEILEGLARLDREALAALDSIDDDERIQEWFRRYLGKKGEITAVLRGLGSLSPEDRRAVGEKANEVKTRLKERLEAHQAALKEAARTAAVGGGIDVTLPGRPPEIGNLHPSIEAMRELCGILAQMGFQVYESPEVETDEFNFGLLNIPPGHPARDMWDTFYTKEEGVVLRTHTSPGQIHVMKKHCPEPIRVILPGKCYRYEDVTARSETMFYQIEGLAIGHDVTMGDLRGVLKACAEQMFGPGRRLRLRKSYFPFTEPSLEADVDCVLCEAKGCKICKNTGWLEILGGGMVHPVVLENGGYDPSVFSGFAFGMGPDRICMLKRGIDDIRYFFSNDARFLDRVGAHRMD